MDTRDAVLRRLALATSEERTHGHFFESTLAGFAELFGSEVAEEARVASPGLKETGPFNCPVGELLRITDAGASAVERQALATYPEVFERIGEFLALGFLQSPIGQAIWRLKGRDVHQVLSSSMVSARASTTHGERGYEKLGPTSARLFFRRELMGPLWVHGFYTPNLRKLSGRHLEVNVERVRESGLDFDLRYTW
jgi:uncharacterized protein (TIGR02265 family)